MQSRAQAVAQNSGRCSVAATAVGRQPQGGRIKAARVSFFASGARLRRDVMETIADRTMALPTKSGTVVIRDRR